MTVMRAGASVVVLGVAAVVGLTLAAESAENQPTKPSADTKSDPDAVNGDQVEKSLSHFMRLKLDASGKILEGLAVEDFALVKEGAQQLHTMSKAEKWRVSNDALYRQFSGDFQRVTKQLVTAAQDENLDRAALKWMDATMGCIECHRYARGIMLADAKPRQGVLP